MKNFKQLKRMVLVQCFYVRGDILWSFGPDYFNLYSVSNRYDFTIQWDNAGKKLKLYRGVSNGIQLNSSLDSISIHNIYNIKFMDYLHKEIVEKYERL